MIAQAHSKKQKLSQPMSHSFGDISELAKGDVGYRRAQLRQCKFSSECGLHSVYPEINGSAHQVLQKINDLVQESKKLQRHGKVGVATGDNGAGEESWEELEMDMSLSEPNLASEESRENASSNGERRRPFSAGLK